MARLVLMLFSLLLFNNLSAQTGRLINSNWSSNGESEVNVSSDNYSFYNKKSKLYYYLSNDYNNIFINLMIEDTGIQKRILEQGLTIWINMDNKLKKITGIRFPIGSQYSVIPNSINLSGNNLIPAEAPIDPLSPANTIELIGFTGEVQRRFPAENSDSFRGVVKYNNEGALFYRMVMPIAKLAVRNSKDGNGAMPFTIGIEYGALPSNNGSGIVTYQNEGPPVLIWIKKIKLAVKK